MTQRLTLSICTWASALRKRKPLLISAQSQRSTIETSFKLKVVVSDTEGVTWEEGATSYLASNTPWLFMSFYEYKSRVSEHDFIASSFT